jgi:hypothetical protein|tara:strand:+ start:970 stop:1215 length:246 start_codon:yes stop_codon:yes gene_type:complete
MSKTWKAISSRVKRKKKKKKEKTTNSGPKVKCLSCFDIIQSMYRHDFKWCSCKGIAVDGGGDYLKMSYQPGAKYEVLDDES